MREYSIHYTTPERNRITKFLKAKHRDIVLETLRQMRYVVTFIEFRDV